jgi:hypothetical protein
VCGARGCGPGLGLGQALSLVCHTFCFPGEELKRALHQRWYWDDPAASADTKAASGSGASDGADTAADAAAEWAYEVLGSLQAPILAALLLTPVTLAQRAHHARMFLDARASTSVRWTRACKEWGT